MYRYMLYTQGVALTRLMGFETNRFDRERLNGIQLKILLVRFIQNYRLLNVPMNSYI